MVLRSYALPILKEGNTPAAFETPSKRIEDGNDLSFFLSSTAYRDIKLWLLQLNRAVFPTEDADGQVSTCTLDSPQNSSLTVTSLRSLLQCLSDLIKEVPPDTGSRRFGNVAFRTWFRLAEEGVDELLERYIPLTLNRHAKGDDERRTALRNELKTYLLGGLGSAQRLDYGTGHELSFLAFLGCLWKLGAFESGDERAIVVGLVQP
jgi:serine/threonine-protein phosphatase 2A activator